MFRTGFFFYKPLGMKYHQTKLLFLSILIVSFLCPLNCVKTGILISTKAIQVVSNYSKELCHISHQIEPKTTKAVKNVINSMSRLSDYNFHEFKHMVNGDRVDTIFALQGQLILNKLKKINKLIKYRERFKSNFRRIPVDSKCKFEINIHDDIEYQSGSALGNLLELNSINDITPITKDIEKTEPHYFKALTTLRAINNALRFLLKILQSEKTCIIQLVQYNELCSNYIKPLDEFFLDKLFLIKQSNFQQNTQGLDVKIELNAFIKNQISRLEKVRCLPFDFYKINDNNLFVDKANHKIGYYHCQESLGNYQFFCKSNMLEDECMKKLFENDYKAILNYCPLQRDTNFEPIQTLDNSVIYKDIISIDGFQVNKSSDFKTFTEIFLDHPAQIFTPFGTFLNLGINEESKIGLNFISKEEYKDLISNLMSLWEKIEDIPYLSQILISLAFSLTFIIVYFSVLFSLKSKKSKKKGRAKITESSILDKYSGILKK